MRKLLFLMMAGLVGFANTTSRAETVHEKKTFFAVQGSTIGELEADMARAGPYIANTGSKHPGAIEVSFDGNVSYKRAAKGGCAVDKPDITLNLNIILPRWQMPSSANDVTRAVWKVVENDIRAHEEHHAAIARNWQKRMISALSNLRPRPTCDQMEMVVQETTRRYLAGHQAAQLEFDRKESQIVDARVRTQIAKAIASLH